MRHLGVVSRRMVLVASAALAAVSVGCAEEVPREYVPERDVLFLETESLTFGYFEEGEGPLVILLHGFPDTAHTWDEVRPALAAEGYRVVTPFLRGYAPSEIPAADEVNGEQSFSATRLGQDVLDIMDALNEDTAVLVGHDFGAFAAYAAATMAPERFTQLVTLAIPHPQAIESNLVTAWNARHFVYLADENAPETFPNGDYAQVNELYARWSPTWEAPASEFEATKNAFSAPGSTNAVLGYYRQAEILPELLMENIQVPTLTIGGVDDGTIDSVPFTNAIIAFDNGYRLEMIENAGHFPHREQPDIVIDLLVEALAAGR